MSRNSGKKEVIPEHFERYYGVSIGELLGLEFLPFEEARNFVRKLGLESRTKWGGYCKSGKRPDNIPGDPAQMYKGKGWVSWGDWLGTGFIYGSNKFNR